jgi:hypothetical protein
MRKEKKHDEDREPADNRDRLRTLWSWPRRWPNGRYKRPRLSRTYGSSDDLVDGYDDPTQRECRSRQPCPYNRKLTRRCPALAPAPDRMSRSSRRAAGHAVPPGPARLRSRLLRHRCPMTPQPIVSVPALGTGRSGQDAGLVAGDPQRVRRDDGGLEGHPRPPEWQQLACPCRRQVGAGRIAGSGGNGRRATRRRGEYETRVIVAGAAGWTEAEAIARELAKLPPSATVVHGDAPGADALAGAAAARLGMGSGSCRPSALAPACFPLEPLLPPRPLFVAARFALPVVGGSRWKAH